MTYSSPLSYWMVKHLADNVHIHNEQGYCAVRWWHHINMDKRPDNLSAISSPVMISITLRPATLMDSFLMCHHCFTLELSTPLISASSNLRRSHLFLPSPSSLSFFCFLYIIGYSLIVSNHMAHLLVLVKFLPITVNSFYPSSNHSSLPMRPLCFYLLLCFFERVLKWNDRQELSSLETQVG